MDRDTFSILYFMREPENRLQLLCVAALLGLIGWVIICINTGDIQQPTGLIVQLTASGVIIFMAAHIYGRGTEQFEQASQNKAALSMLADFASDLYWETDLKGQILEVRGRLLSKLIPNRETLIGKHYLSILKLDPGEMQKMLAAINQLQSYSDILSTLNDPAGLRYYLSLSATPRFDHNGELSGYIGVGTNVTERIESQARLQHMAEHDMLTGLANRYAFQSRIDADLSASPDDQNVAILAIDLDNFKHVNDTYGHQAGDALLNLVAKRIRKVVRNGDWAARLGGDEFVVVCRNVSDPVDAGLVAARLQLALSKPYQIGGVELESTASIGVACAPSDANTADKLLKCADLALYDAKANGRACFRYYTDTLTAQAS